MSGVLLRPGCYMPVPSAGEGCAAAGVTGSGHCRRMRVLISSSASPTRPITAARDRQLAYSGGANTREGAPASHRTVGGCGPATAAGRPRVAQLPGSDPPQDCDGSGGKRRSMRERTRHRRGVPRARRAAPNRGSEPTIVRLQALRHRATVPKNRPPYAAMARAGLSVALRFLRAHYTRLARGCRPSGPAQPPMRAAAAVTGRVEARPSPVRCNQ